MQTVEGFDRGRGGGALFKLDEARAGLERWADAAAKALEWGESGESSIVRKKMVEAASERFLDESVVAK